MRNMAEKSREVLEFFFGGPMPLPELGTLPNIISSVFSSLRARTLDFNKCYSYTRAKVILWLIAIDLYNAFFFSQRPNSRLKRACAFDLNYY
ncbi:hypothetical protein F4824DRAFT_513831 [Ustulina deusta]|nr:hypothetical protein F4824DRAFT_513831 [Ustulina deusta]